MTPEIPQGLTPQVPAEGSAPRARGRVRARPGGRALLVTLLALMTSGGFEAPTTFAQMVAAPHGSDAEENVGEELATRSTRHSVARSERLEGAEESAVPTPVAATGASDRSETGRERRFRHCSLLI